MRLPGGTPAPMDAVQRAGAQAAYLLRVHALERLGAALGAEGLAVLLVKGAALAMSHYPRPWERAMADIDLVVRPGARERTLAALVKHGFTRVAGPERPLSRDFFGETCLTLACGAASVLFELHTTLDKLVPRPVDHAAIFARATPAPDLSGVWLPADEDHLLLLALHAAAHDFHHEPACADVELLLARGLDEAAVLERARRWRLGTVLFVMLSLLREGGSTRVSDGLLRALEPGGLRLAAVQRYRAHVADPETSRSLGWPWIARQTVLRDDLSAWVRGLVSYAGVRVVEAAMLRVRGDQPSFRAR